MAWVIYPNMKEAMLDSNIAANRAVDFEDDNISLRLYDSTWAYNAAHDFRSDFSAADEVTGTNYVRKDLTAINTTLASATVTVDGIGASSDFKYVQSASGFNNARTAVLYKKDASSTAANEPLIAYNTFSANQNNVSGDLTLQFSASGIFTLA